MINELLEHKKIDQLELSVTSATGGENTVDINHLLSHFSQIERREDSETVFYSASN
jgi:hypothetical protein